MHGTRYIDRGGNLVRVGYGLLGAAAMSRAPPWHPHDDRARPIKEAVDQRECTTLIVMIFSERSDVDASQVPSRGIFTTLGIKLTSGLNL